MKKLVRLRSISSYICSVNKNMISRRAGSILTLEELQPIALSQLEFSRFDLIPTLIDLPRFNRFEATCPGDAIFCGPLPNQFSI
jgi:hypothetical protein